MGGDPPGGEGAVYARRRDLEPDRRTKSGAGRAPEGGETGHRRRRRGPPRSRGGGATTDRLAWRKERAEEGHRRSVRETGE